MTDTALTLEQTLEPLIRGRLEYRASRGDSDAQQLLDRVTNAWADIATGTVDEAETAR